MLLFNSKIYFYLIWKIKLKKIFLKVEFPDNLYTFFNLKWKSIKLNEITFIDFKIEFNPIKDSFDTGFNPKKNYSSNGDPNFSQLK
jgi:hypothetical protein